MVLTKEKMHYAEIFLLVFLSSSYVVTNNIIPSILTTFLWVCLLWALLRQASRVKFVPLVFGGALLVLMGISVFYNGENIRSFLINCYSILVVILTVSSISLEEFMEKYCVIMEFLCAISLFGYGLFLLIPSLHSLFVVTNMAGIPASNLFIYIDTIQNNRNMGMFWEPGAFQMFINLAILFAVVQPKIDIKKVLLYSLTLITTYSTTGYITFLLILLLIYINKGKNRNAKIVITVASLVAIPFIYLNQDLLFGRSLANGQSTVFGKLANFTSKGIGRSTILTSADIRYNSVIGVWEAFLERPYVGYGYQGLINRMYDFTHGMNTCTFINYFATYGVVFGSVCLFGMLTFAKRISGSVLGFIVIMTSLFVMTMSENFIENPFVYLIILYGIRNELIPQQKGAVAYGDMFN